MARSVRRLVVLVLASVVLMGGSIQLATADPDLQDVPPHRHVLVTTTGEREVGPRVCDNPNLQDAFNQFHHNVHVDSDGHHEHDQANVEPRRC
jgi:hypothetical protein